MYQLRIRDSDWLNFIHVSGYKYKIRLVSILRKREDQALISISTILKFSAQFTFFFLIISSNRFFKSLLRIPVFRGWKPFHGVLETNLLWGFERELFGPRNRFNGFLETSIFGGSRTLFFGSRNNFLCS